MNTIFRIKELTKTEQGVWHVQLTLTDNNDKQLKVLTDLVRDNTAGATSWHRLARLLIEMQELKQAEDVYHMLLNLVSIDDEIEIGLLNNQLGYIRSLQDDVSDALFWYGRTLDIQRKTLPPDHLNLSTTYSNIGNIYEKMQDHSKSHSFFQKTLNILEKNLPPDHPTVAVTYNNMARVLDGMGDYSKTLVFYENTLKIEQKTLLSIDCNSS